MRLSPFVRSFARCAALLVGIVLLGFGASSADPITVDAGWSLFSWSGSVNVPAFATPVFTFSSAAPTTVRITDAFCRGDRFTVYDNEASLGDTPAVAIDECPAPEELSDPDAAFADPSYSSATFVLGAGTHSLAVQALNNPFGGGAAFLRVDSIPVIASPDTYATTEDATLSVPAPGVLANDSGVTLTAELVTLAEHGATTLNADGSFTYVPHPNFNGVDSFQYQARRGSTVSDVATVTITVGAVNDPPFFNPIADQFVDVPVGGSQTVEITGLAPGPVNESAQAVTLSAESSNPALISHPTIGGDAAAPTLSYQRVGSTGGTATITVRAQDDGGTANGGADLFARAFDVTLSGAAAVQGSVVTFTPNPDPTKAPSVTVTITASPIDFDGNGVIECPEDAYLFFPPRSPGQPYNVVPSNADRVPEGPPWRIPEDTVEICGSTQTFTAVLDLSEWITEPTGTTELTYVSIVRDPELSPTGECPVGATCFHRIWTGVKPLGSVTFAAAHTAGVKSTVSLRTYDTATKASSSSRLGHVPIRVFDIKDPELRAVAQGAIKSESSISMPSLSKVLGKIYEADKGRIGACETDDTGLCFASQPAPGYDLIVAKFVDAGTGHTVYVGDIKRPKDFVNGIATSNLVIIKLLENGVFKGYAQGILLHVE